MLASAFAVWLNSNMPDLYLPGPVEQGKVQPFALHSVGDKKVSRPPFLCKSWTDLHLKEPIRMSEVRGACICGDLDCAESICYGIQTLPIMGVSF